MVEISWYWEVYGSEEMKAVGYAESFTARAHLVGSSEEEDLFQIEYFTVHQLMSVRNASEYRQWRAEEGLRTLITEVYRKGIGCDE